MKLMMVGEKERLKKEKYIKLYIDIATRIAEMSFAKRLHVGAVIVKKDNIISFGWNGMPSGWDNECEDVVTPTLPYLHGDGPTLKTKPEVLHAEQNALAKLAKSTESGDGATMFITHAPCIDCAKLVFQSGISSVYYRNSYRDDSGIGFLERAGVKVEKL
jgi:dCMP deaminase